MQQAMSILTSHASAEWYTPPFIIDLAKKVLGKIDLDPASNEFAQKWIKAKRYYSPPKSNGLVDSWKAETIWLNPPYGKIEGGSSQAIWSKRMSDLYEQGEFEQGILLINSTHGYKWYENLWIKYPVCCLRERLKFIKEDGTVGGQAKRGQTLVLFHHSEVTLTRFQKTFKPFGRIVLP